MLNRLEENRANIDGRIPKYAYYFTEMDHSDGSVGANFYEGQIRVNYNVEKSKTNIPSIYLDPKKDGYGRLVYLTSINLADTSHMDDILGQQDESRLQNCIIMEGQWKNGKLHGFGRTFDQNGGCYRGQYVDGMRSGPGAFYWTNGDIFDGEYKNNMQNGIGIFYCAEMG